MSTAPVNISPPRFFVAVWELTLRCNLACGHCGSRAGHARTGELSTGEALDVVSQLAGIGVTEVTLIGGEAYLRPDWETIARAITKRGMTCSMVTAGRGLDAEMARRMKAAGIVNVSVSLDGLEETHNTQRGWGGSYEAAIAALKNLAQAGIATCVNTQINRLSICELEALFEILADAAVWAWRVQLTVAMGRAADRPDWLLQPYELLDLFPRLAALKVLCRERDMTLFPGNNIGYFGPYENLLRGDMESAGHWTGCHAGDGVLGIEADGTLKGCPSLPTSPYAGGNLRERTLRDMMETTSELRFTRDRSSKDLWGLCGECYYSEVCRGGCTWTSHVLFGRAGNNPYCHYRALQLEKQGLRERLVPRKSAPGKPFDYGRFDLVVEPMPANNSDRINLNLELTDASA